MKSVNKRGKTIKYVIASENNGKVQELKEILSEFGIETVSRAELGISVGIEETGSTFTENARLKAEAVCKASGLPAIGDDSGLVVDALGGQPGVYSRRFGGEHLSDSERNAFLLEKLEAVRMADTCGSCRDPVPDLGGERISVKNAKFVCAIVCAFPDGDEISAVGECRGTIIPQPRGDYGFGYDPIFLLDGTDKTMAELTAEQKNRISHRGIALKKFCAAIDEADSRLSDAVW